MYNFGIRFGLLYLLMGGDTSAKCGTTSQRGLVRCGDICCCCRFQDHQERCCLASRSCLRRSLRLVWTVVIFAPTVAVVMLEEKQLATDDKNALSVCKLHRPSSEFRVTSTNGRVITLNGRCERV
jgi:hypothetical protein